MSLGLTYVIRCPVRLWNNVVVMLAETTECVSTDHKLVVSDVQEQRRTLKARSGGLQLLAGKTRLGCIVYT
jgi:hypothetical protein